MPDHVHVLAEGQRDDAVFPEFVRLWKQATAFHVHKQHGVTLWQRGYYEHMLRSNESVVYMARYILRNPVRAGLVTHPTEYPWVGSFVTTLEALLEVIQDDGGWA
jgi:putative transposase